MTALSRIGSRQMTVAAVACVLAISLGVLSAAQPLTGIIVAIGGVVFVIVSLNLFAGYALLAMFAFLEVLTVQGGVSLTKAIGAVVVLAWLAAASLRRDRVRNLFRERPGLTYLLIAFLAWNLMSVAWSPSSSDATESVMRYALDALLVPIGYAAVSNRRDAVRILAVLVIGATVAALAAFVSPIHPEAAGYERATSTVGDPNELAAALVVGMALAVSFAANKAIKPTMRALSLLSAVLCLAAITLTLSRDGLLGLGAALALAVLIGGKWRRPALKACGIAIGGIVVYFGVIASAASLHRVITPGNGSGRVALWTVALRMIDAHPLNGIGTGQFASSAGHYLLQPGFLTGTGLILTVPKVAHNTYLNVLAETGIVGGALFIAFIAWCIWCTWCAIKRFERDGDERLELLARGLLIALGGFLTTAFFVSDELAKLMWILLALGPIMLAVASLPRERSATRGTSAA